MFLEFVIQRTPCLEPEDNWPTAPVTEPTEDPEAKRLTVMRTSLIDTTLLEKYSSINKVKRIIPYLLRFKEPVGDKSKLQGLNPVLDSSGIIRVGGRLSKSELPYEQKYPILLPKNHHITEMIVRHAHQEHAHAAVSATLYALRRRFWSMGGRNYIRQLLFKCIPCIKAKPPTVDYIMGDLPQARVTKARSFLNVGVDYCGSFMVKEKQHHNRGQVKTYVAVFVCLVTKAIHLELVSGMTTAGFMAALRRFIARRGRCQLIQSDNGTNFVGANNEMTELVETLRSEAHNKEVAAFLNDKGIKWRFIPPAAPHFGGIWEAAVKSFKHHLKRVVGPELLTFEQLNTFIIEIESILNSRPLTPVSSDPNDLLALTPGHFLIGESLTSLPEHDLRKVPNNRLDNWELIQKIRQHFWQRWYKEYLSELTMRRKWKSGQHSIKEGALVILKEDNLPRMHWKLGRIIEIHPGNDGMVRVATIKTASGILKRTVKKLSPLPVPDNDKEN
ncbi:uncharacterized protein LOC107045476 [Diachasma alloeum]|uniref:uncharacterized protein LOC107045476 n=1 Tax=Diachasma alloeum TaxID=454923 RepID=UPI0007383EE9|nr:uncharacterized protein LOC107045476 [Diachasma alloeum]